MVIDRERYLTVDEAATKSGYDPNHVRKLVKKHAVAILEIAPRKYLVDWIDLKRYMDEKPQRKPHQS